jgi:hypothetical protein
VKLVHLVGFITKKLSLVLLLLLLLLLQLYIVMWLHGTRIFVTIAEL